MRTLVRGAWGSESVCLGEGETEQEDGRCWSRRRDVH